MAERVDHPKITLQLRMPEDALPGDLPEDVDGELDDLAVEHPEMFRLERMSDDHVWMAVYMGDGSRLVIDIGVKDGKLVIGDYLEE